MHDAEAHMLRTKSPRRRGRPFGPSPLFLDDCTRIDATALLARSRGARVSAWETATADVRGSWTLKWTEDGRPQYRIVELHVTVSRQPLGGLRSWWRCPTCRRRCRLLFAVDPRAPIGCRLCVGGRYFCDYPGRVRPLPRRLGLPDPCCACSPCEPRLRVATLALMNFSIAWSRRWVPRAPRCRGHPVAEPL